MPSSDVTTVLTSGTDDFFSHIRIVTAAGSVEWGVENTDNQNSHAIGGHVVGLKGSWKEGIVGFTVITDLTGCDGCLDAIVTVTSSVGLGNKKHISDGVVGNIFSTTADVDCGF